jgi:hypothetical protein
MFVAMRSRRRVVVAARRPPSPRLALLLGGLAGLLVACHDGGSRPPTVSDTRDAAVSPPAVRDVAVAAPFTRLALGTRIPLAVTVHDVTARSSPTARWRGARPTRRSSPSTRAGVVTARAIGSAQVTAGVGGQTGTVALTVIAVPVAGVMIDRSNVTVVYEGDRLDLRAWTVDSAGGALAGRALSFASSAPSVAAISPAGEITALAAGRTTLTVPSEGRSASAELSVGGLRAAFATGSGGCLRMRVGTTCNVFAQVRTSGGNLAGRRALRGPVRERRHDHRVGHPHRDHRHAAGARRAHRRRRPRPRPGLGGDRRHVRGPSGVRREDTFPVIVEP